MVRPRNAVDLVAPSALLAIAVAEAATSGIADWGAAVAFQAAVAVLLVLRRSWPLASCTAAGVVLASIPYAGPQLDELAAPILFLALIGYSLARWCTDLRGLLGLAAVLLVLLSVYTFVDQRSHDVTDVVFVLAIAAPPYVLGRISRRLAEQSRLIAQQSEQLSRQAVREERDRIARELHDVIAHSVSAMVVQTAAARDLVEPEPDRALAILDSVAETGRRTLAETGRLLHLVRDEADELGLAPAPGLSDVPVLVAELAHAGLEVDSHVDLPATVLPSGVDVSAYRVVQEALTNALRYGDGTARLTVGATASELRIGCTNRIGPAAATSSGLGLTGMAERIAMLGGSLRHGRVGDRFEVEAVVPVPSELVP